MRLTGPVFFYDLIRNARRGRYTLLRCVYVLILFGVFYFVYQTFAARIAMEMEMQARYPGNFPGNTSARVMAQFGAVFFAFFMFVQSLAIFFLTPAYVAGAITEEKQRQTMDYLLTTDLTNRELVLGKFFSRVANLLLFLIAGLPVLALAQLVGGIDPELVWGGFAASLITVLSLSSLAIYLSVYARRVREALIKSYLLAIGYFVGWGALAAFRLLMRIDMPEGSAPLLVMDEITAVYNWGNPLVALYRLEAEFRRAGTLGMAPLIMLGKYAAFHGFFLLFFLFLAVRNVRRVYVRQTYEGKPARRRRKLDKVAQFIPAGEPAPVAVMEPPDKPLPRRIRRRPPVGGSPMNWKERYCERGLAFGVLLQTLLILTIFLLVAPGVVLSGVVTVNLLMGTGGAMEFGRGMNVYLRFVCGVLFCLLLLGVGIRGAGSIGSEKDRQTWDGLLASPLSLRTILLAKWWASVRTGMWFMILLAMLTVLGLATLGLHFFGALAFLATVAVFVPFAASLGMVFAVRARSALRGLIGIVVTLVALSGLPLLLGTLVMELDQQASRTRMYGRNYGMPWSAAALYSLSPPFLMEISLFSPEQMEEYFLEKSHRYSLSGYGPPSDGDISDTGKMLICAVIAVGVYVFLTWALWAYAYSTLRRTCGRIDGAPRPRRRVEMAMPT